MRYFNNQRCLEKHLKAVGNDQHRSVPICDQLKRCRQCRKEYKTREDHKCSLKHCSTCKTDYQDYENHLCYIQPWKPKGSELINTECTDEESEEAGPSSKQAKRTKKEKQTTFMFYDIECPQETAVGQNENGKIFLHTPNLVVVHKVCDACCDAATLGSCQYCNENRKVFKGDESIDQFCEWLFSKNNKDAIAVAHNAKGYDAQFILDYCHRSGLKPDRIISRGLEILFMQVGSIQFKDSLCFLPMALSALPKAFDIEECKKG